MLLVNLALWILSLLTKEDYIMAIATVYATLIIKGRKTFDQVPDKIKEQVKQVLIDLEVDPSLYGEEDTVE